MVISKKQLAGAVLLLGIGICFALMWFQRESPELEIRRTLQTLAECASKLPGTGAASSLAKVRTAGELFTDPAVIEITGTGFSGSMSQVLIQQHLARYRSMLESALAETEDVSVILTGKDQGEAVFSGRLRGRTRTGTTISEVREMHVFLSRNRDGKWQIHRLQAEDVLEK